MKTIAYTALLYGSDYLPYAIRSIIDYVDEYWVLYTENPSHGHRGGGVPKPQRESRENLYRIATLAAGNKLHWIDGNWHYEGQHRDTIFEVCPDADMILVLDSDEIWTDGLPFVAINFWKMNWNHLALPPYRNYRVPIIHYWRSFHRCVLYDPAYPVRVIYPQVEGGEAVLDSFDKWGCQGNQQINHMGYAIRPDLMRYKLSIHGHKNEFPDIEKWYQGKFLANEQEDCHPVGSEYWNPETVDPMDHLPQFMQEHPFYEMDVIE